MPAVGPVVGIGTSLLGGWLGSRQSKAEKQAMAASQTAMSNLTGAGQQAMGYAKDQYNLSAPAYQQAMTYYQRLLGGNRALMSQAVAGPSAQINDLYRGAESGLMRGTARGGERDLAEAQLNRDRVGKLAGLTTGVQPMAADALGRLAGNGLNLSSNFLGQGVGAFGAVGDIASNMYKNAQAHQEAAGKAWGAAGKSIYDIVKGTKWGQKHGF